MKEDSQETSEEETAQQVSEEEKSPETSEEEGSQQVSEQEKSAETSEEEGSQQVTEESDEPAVEPLEEQLQQEPSELPSSFAFTVASTDMQRFLGGRSSRGLIGGWTAFMYDKFHAVYPLCALVFRYNHCRKSDSKKTSPFWIGRAKCRTGNCIEVCNTCMVLLYVYSRKPMSLS